MFKNNENLIQLDPEIFIYKNFLSAEECNKYLKEISTFKEDEWDNHEDSDKPKLYSYKQVMRGSDMFTEIYLKAKDFFEPEFTPLPCNGVSRLNTGQSLGLHWDSVGNDEHNNVTDLDRQKFQDQINSNDIFDPLHSCLNVKYAYVVYINDFEGGDIYYPEVNISYSPKPGDMIIHSSSKKYKHGVKKVISGPRYAFNNFIVPSSYTSQNISNMESQMISRFENKNK